jgi:hypothetical protein
MKPKNLISAGALTLAAAILTPPAAADSGTVTAFVNRTQVTADASFGGCMALLSVDPATVLPLCGANWVTFSCTGDFTDQVRAYRMLDQAQLALAANKQVSVVITDTSLHNGYCFATRIDVVK